MKDDFGDRMKAYEEIYTDPTVSIDQILCVRIDGKGFSRYTKFSQKPFDYRLHLTMTRVTERLVEETHATIGYTQSDEITLIFTPGEHAHEYIFGGKVSKINSIVASMASAFFNEEIKKYFPDLNKLAFFDCRAWGVPDIVEASNVLLWRVQDCKRNSVSSMFRYTLGHKLGMNVSTKDKIAMLSEAGHSWEVQDDRFKYGTMITVGKDLKQIPDEVWNKIPDESKPENRWVQRSVYVRLYTDFTQYDLESRVKMIGDRYVV